MKSLEQLASEFDSLVKPVSTYVTPRPTESSLQRINAHFGISLPLDLVEFAAHSRNFGHWFASLGDDYTSTKHIIRINSYWRRRRRTRAAPRGLVIINIGFDDDLDCIDISSLDRAAGEYAIRYWSPGVEAAGLRVYGSFREYVEATVNYWAGGRTLAHIDAKVRI